MKSIKTRIETGQETTYTTHSYYVGG